MNTADEHFVTDWLAKSVDATTAFAGTAEATRTLLGMADTVAEALRTGGRLLVAGNGGSAADAQHIAGEFVSRMNYDRDPLAAIALTTDSSALTAIGNDYGYEFVFERQVLALGRPGDVFLGISTSGRSPNILRALAAARAAKLATLGFTGTPGAAMDALCDHVLHTPVGVTPFVQQLHIIAAHILCSLVERALCPLAA